MEKQENLFQSTRMKKQQKSEQEKMQNSRYDIQTFWWPRYSPKNLFLEHMNKYKRRELLLWFLRAKDKNRLAARNKRNSFLILSQPFLPQLENIFGRKNEYWPNRPGAVFTITTPSLFLAPKNSLIQTQKLVKLFLWVLKK